MTKWQGLAVIQELGIQNHVAITGMGAEVGAVKRILADKQDITIYMDLKELSETAVTQAVNIVLNEPVEVNAEMDNVSGASIKSNLITGQIITKENIDKILIDTGIYTREEIYE